MLLIMGKSGRHLCEADIVLVNTWCNTNPTVFSVLHRTKTVSVSKFVRQILVKGVDFCSDHPLNFLRAVVVLKGVSLSGVVLFISAVGVMKPGESLASSMSRLLSSTSHVEQRAWPLCISSFPPVGVSFGPEVRKQKEQARLEFHKCNYAASARWINDRI